MNAIICVSKGPPRRHPLGQKYNCKGTPIIPANISWDLYPTLSVATQYQQDL